MINKICPICNKEFQTWPCRIKTLYCSNNCRFESNKGNKYAQGNKLSKETRLKMKESKEGLRDESTNRWKGDDVGYSGLHMWVRRKLGKPKKCEYCGKDHLIGHQIHWANISGRYLRKLDDWIRLCAFCHKQFDKKLIY